MTSQGPCKKGQAINLGPGQVKSRATNFGRGLVGRQRLGSPVSDITGRSGRNTSIIRHTCKGEARRGGRCRQSRQGSRVGRVDRAGRGGRMDRAGREADLVE